MSVKKEASGRRSVQVEVEVPGTPEEVWQAIATGPGISAWFVPTEVVERDGKPVAVKSNFGPGMESVGDRDRLGPAPTVRGRERGLGSERAADGHGMERRGPRGRRLRRPRRAQPLCQHRRLGQSARRHRIRLARLLPHPAAVSHPLPRPALARRCS